MTLTLPVLGTQWDIPKRYTCDGDNVSPTLAWSEVPSGAKTLALIMDDPDAPDPAKPRMTWVHWVLYNIPAATGLSEAMATRSLPPGTLEGKNDWRKTGYGGPCPPIGRHRYVHKLYALDVVLPDLRQPNKAALEAAMQGHILAQAQRVRTYQHARNGMANSANARCAFRARLHGAFRGELDR